MRWRLLPVIVLLVSCAKVKEPTTYARYLIDNRSGTPLHVELLPINNGQVLTDSIPAHCTCPLMDVIECTGGHVLPSNFVSAFLLTTTDSSGNPVEVYQGVHNSDWHPIGSSADRTELVLIVE